MCPFQLSNQVTAFHKTLYCTPVHSNVVLDTISSISYNQYEERTTPYGGHDMYFGVFK